MSVKTIVKVAAAIASISVMAGAAQAQYRTPQQVRDAQQVAHMQNILAQLQAEQRRQAALRGGRAQYVQPLASSSHAGTLGGNFSGGLGSTTIGGAYGSGLTVPSYFGRPVYSETLETRWGRLSPQEQAKAMAYELYLTQLRTNSLNVNRFGTHVYRY